MHAREVEGVGDDVGPERSAVDLLGGRADGHEAAGVVRADRLSQGRGPFDGVFVVGGFAVDPERRLVGEVPRDQLGAARPPAGQLRGVGGLEFDEFGVGMRVDAARPRKVPVGVADLAAHEKGRVKRDSMGLGRIEDSVEDGQVRLVEAAAFGLDGRPQQIDAGARQTVLGHLGEGPVKGLGAFAPRPVRPRRRHDVRAHRDMRLSAGVHEVPAHGESRGP